MQRALSLSILIKRIAHLIPVLWGISTIVFFLQRLIPGSPADAVLGADVDLAAKTEWLAKYGFEKPLSEQYFRYLGNLLQGDFGNSFANYQPVFELIRPRLWQTVQLALSAFGFSLFIAVIVGLISAAYAGKTLDKVAAVVSLLAVSAPTFIIGPILAWIFSVKLDWFPLIGNQGFLSFVLPTVTLGSALAAFSSRMIRSGLVDVLSEDYIRTARSKGLAPHKVIAKHALRNAFLPTLTILGMQLGVLLSGTIITEQIFAWPGLGSLTVEAVQSREYNLLSACVLVMALMYVLSNLLVDILYRVLDPRVRLR
jgi:peptide/nickel transport system permease protein